MAIDLSALRELVALDPDDPLGRFSLGQKLLAEVGTPQALSEAVEHLRFVNERHPEHLATYQALAQALIQMGSEAQARGVLEEGIRRAGCEMQGSGHDLVPILESLLDSI